MICAQDVDLVLTNGNIYTVNEKQPHAEAITVKGDRIVFVGSNEDARKFRGDKTRVVDLGGKTVVPGLTDSHCHIFGIGERFLDQFDVFLVAAGILNFAPTEPDLAIDAEQ